MALGGPLAIRPLGIVFDPTISNNKNAADKWATTQVITEKYDLKGDQSDAPTGTKKYAHFEYSRTVADSIETDMLDVPRNAPDYAPLSSSDYKVKDVGTPLAKDDGPRRVLTSDMSARLSTTDYCTFVMYRPVGIFNIFVPLKVCAWYVDFDVYRRYTINQVNNRNVKAYVLLRGAVPPWEFNSGNASEFISGNPIQFPTWDRNVADYYYPLWEAVEYQ